MPNNVINVFVLKVQFEILFIAKNRKIATNVQNSYERIMNGISNIDDIGGMIVETMNYSHFRGGTHEHRIC